MYNVGNVSADGISYAQSPLRNIRVSRPLIVKVSVDCLSMQISVKLYWSASYDFHLNSPRMLSQKVTFFEQFITPGMISVKLEDSTLIHIAVLFQHWHKSS